MTFGGDPGAGRRMQQHERHRQRRQQREAPRQRAAGRRPCDQHAGDRNPAQASLAQHQIERLLQPYAGPIQLEAGELLFADLLLRDGRLLRGRVRLHPALGGPARAEHVRGSEQADREQLETAARERKGAAQRDRAGGRRRPERRRAAAQRGDLGGRQQSPARERRPQRELHRVGIHQRGEDEELDRLALPDPHESEVPVPAVRLARRHQQDHEGEDGREPVPGREQAEQARVGDRDQAGGQRRGAEVEDLDGGHAAQERDRRIRQLEAVKAIDREVERQSGDAVERVGREQRLVGRIDGGDGEIHVERVVRIRTMGDQRVQRGAQRQREQRELEARAPRRRVFARHLEQEQRERRRCQRRDHPVPESDRMARPAEAERADQAEGEPGQSQPREQRGPRGVSLRGGGDGRGSRTPAAREPHPARKGDRRDRREDRQQVVQGAAARDDGVTREGPESEADAGGVAQALGDRARGPGVARRRFRARRCQRFSIWATRSRW